MFVSSNFSSIAMPKRTRWAAVVVAVIAAALVGFTAPSGASAEGTTPVSVSALSPAEVEKLLSTIPLKDLSAQQLSEVLAGHISGSPSSGLTEALEKSIAGLAGKGDTLEQLAGSSALVSELEKQVAKLPLSERLSLEGLLGLLTGGKLSTLLGETLGSLNARTLVGELLRTASEPGQQVGPEQLVEQLLSAPNPEQLEKLLGTTLTGEPFTEGTVEELANSEGTTTKGLAEGFDTSTSQLPASAMALTAPLSNGELLGVLDALEGVDVGTLGHETPGGSGGDGSGGSSGNSGGGVGGTGGSGGTSSGTPGGTVVVYGLASPGATTIPGTKPASGKVKIISHRVKGDAITLVVEAPAAGKLTVAGKGVKTVDKQADKAERVSVEVLLDRAAVASVRKHHRLEAKLAASFQPVSGARSTASASVAVG
jgi:hypothetical protein